MRHKNAIKLCIHNLFYKILSSLKKLKNINLTRVFVRELLHQKKIDRTPKIKKNCRKIQSNA